jgi:putative transposase
MTTRKINLAQGEFFHLYNRGVDKRVIYNSKVDYRRFLELLYLCNSSEAVSLRDVHQNYNSIFDFDRGDPLVAIGAYCLMPNHFHILATPLVEGGVTTFMGKIGTGYSMYFNKKHERTGALFQGRFKSQHADTDEYLKYLYAYIHLNPVKLIDPTWKEVGIKDAAKSFDFAASFQYSSLPDYLGKSREEKAIISPAVFPEYFQTPMTHKNELFEWLNYQTQVI